MLQVNLFDTNNPLENSHFNLFQKDEEIEYIRPPLPIYNGPSLFTDEMIVHPMSEGIVSKYKFGAFLEPRSIKPHAYNVLCKNPEIINRFDAIFTHDEELLELSDRVKLLPFLCGSYFLKEDHKIYPKSKMLSMVANSKGWAEGHRLRHEIITRFGSYMDSYGPWYTDMKKEYEDYPEDTLRNQWLKGTGNILQAFKDYRYAFFVPSIRCKNFFNEQLVNCFTTGTIPIAWGPTNIGDFFDERGIITFNKIEDLEDILPTLSAEDYSSRSEAMHINFELAKKYYSFDKTLREAMEEVMK